MRERRTRTAPVSELAYVFEELAAEPRHAAQFRERFGFDLPNPLAADTQLFADLAERTLVATVQTEAEPQDLPLARVQLIERGLQALREVGGLGRLARGIGRGVVADQVAPRQLAVFAKWRLERQRHARSASRFVDPLGID